MRLKTNVEDGVIMLFSVTISGYTQAVLKDLLQRLWLKNRYTSRFYFAVKQRCYSFVVDVTTFNRKETLYKEEFIRLIKGVVPKEKKKFTIE